MYRSDGAANTDELDDPPGVGSEPLPSPGVPLPPRGVPALLRGAPIGPETTRSPPIAATPPELALDEAVPTPKSALGEAEPKPPTLWIDGTGPREPVPDGGGIPKELVCLSAPGSAYSEAELNVGGLKGANPKEGPEEGPGGLLGALNRPGGELPKLGPPPRPAPLAYPLVFPAPGPEPGPVRGAYAPELTLLLAGVGYDEPVAM